MLVLPRATYHRCRPNGPGPEADEGGCQEEADLGGGPELADLGGGSGRYSLGGRCMAPGPLRLLQEEQIQLQ